jgi:hypothetical protein
VRDAGNFTVALSIVGEITDGTNAAEGFAIFGVTFGIASFCKFPPIRLPESP